MQYRQLHIAHCKSSVVTISICVYNCIVLRNMINNIYEKRERERQFQPLMCLVFAYNSNQVSAFKQRMKWPASQVAQTKATGKETGRLPRGRQARLSGTNTQISYVISSCTSHSRARENCKSKQMNIPNWIRCTEFNGLESLMVIVVCVCELATVVIKSSNQFQSIWFTDFIWCLPCYWYN